MDIQTTVLVAHLAGAGITVAAVLVAIGVIVANNTNRYRVAAQWLAGLTVLQVFTGSLLSVLTAQGSLFLLCSRMGIYFAVIGLVEMVLLTRFPQPYRTTFPAQFVGGAFVVSLVIVSAAGVMLFL